MNKFLGIIVLVLVFGACAEKEKKTPSDEEAQRTVLAYLIGDNDLVGSSNELGEYLLSDFEEMMEGMKYVDDTKNKLIVYCETKNDVPRLVHIKKYKGEVIADTIHTYPERNPLKKINMIETLEEVFAKFPAKSYGLILASHGEGWIEAPTSADTRWFGMYRSTYMNIADLREALEGMPHLDFLLFDACYMQSIEVAYELRNSTNYLISSPTEIPGPGGAYQKMVPAMFADKADVAIDVAKAYYEFYKDIYEDKLSFWPYGVSISVIKTGQLEEFASVTRNMISQYAGGQKKNDTSSLFCYGKTQNSSCYYYDFDGLMRLLIENSADYIVWRTLFDSIQPYFATTPKNCVNRMSSRYYDMTGAEGIYMYIPEQDGYCNTYYRTLSWYEVGGWKDAGW